MAYNTELESSEHVLASNKGVVTNLYISSNYIVVGLDNGQLHVFDQNGKNERIANVGKAIWDSCGGIDSHSEWLCIGGVDGLLDVWDLDKLEKTTRMIGHTNTVRCIGAIGGDKIISGSRDNMLRLWDRESGNCLAILEGHERTVRCLAVAADIAVSGSYDHTARIWDLGKLALAGRTGSAAEVEKIPCRSILTGHEGNIFTIAFNGKKIVTGSLDNTARLWDPMSGHCLAVFTANGLVSHLFLGVSNLICADNTGMVWVWSVASLTQQREIRAHDNAITSMQTDGDMIVTGSSDGKARVWNLRTGELGKELVTDSQAVWKVGTIGNSFEGIVAVFMKNDEVVLQVC